MRYTKEKAALQAYIDSFDPDEFSSGRDLAALSPTPEQLARIQKLKTKLKRRRQVVASWQSLFDKQNGQSETIITQDEVDALVEEWAAKKQ